MRAYLVQSRYRISMRLALAIVSWMSWNFSVVADIRFQGPEIFPIDPRLQELRASDLDGDGYQDLVVINNRRSRIQVLYNQTSKPKGEEPAPATKEDINELPADARFRVDSISSEKRVTSVVVTDFVGDALPDIVYCGNQEDVVVLENRGQGEWAEAGEWQVPEVVADGESLQIGDVNGDERSELVVLTESYFYLIERTVEAENQRPTRVLHAGDLSEFQLTDVNGDGFNDILSSSQKDPEHFYLRLGGAEGLSASESLVSIADSRFARLVRLSGREEANIVSISQRSGRANLSGLEKAVSPVIYGNIRNGQWIRVGLPASRQVDRGLASADLNGDGRVDLAAVDPDAGKVLVYFQGQDGDFDPPAAFGSYGGIRQIKIVDWDGDGSVEMFLLSQSEQQVGVTQWSESGGIRFPKSIELRGKPLGIAVGNLRPNAGVHLVVLEQVQRAFQLVTVDSDHALKRFDVELGIRADKVDLLMHDVDQDGLRDIVILGPYEPLWILRQLADGGGFDSIQMASNTGDLERPWAGELDLDLDGKPELILPQKNAVRGVVMTPRSSVDGSVGWSTEVKVQINGAESSSVIAGFAAIRESEGSDWIICLLDIGNNQLSYLRKDGGGQWRIIQSDALPRGDYTGLHRSTFGASDDPALLLAGGDHLFLLSLGGRSWRLKVEETYESRLDGGFLSKCVVADFDADKDSEFVFLETAKHNIEIVTASEASQMKLDQRWPVFEARTFRNRRKELPEPREAIVEDFTGDGRLDLLLLVHDRILLYPQL